MQPFYSGEQSIPAVPSPPLPSPPLPSPPLVLSCPFCPYPFFPLHIPFPFVFCSACYFAEQHLTCLSSAVYTSRSSAGMSYSGHHRTSLNAHVMCYGCNYIPDLWLAEGIWLWRQRHVRSCSPRPPRTSSWPSAASRSSPTAVAAITRSPPSSSSAVPSLCLVFHLPLVSWSWTSWSNFDTLWSWHSLALHFL